MIRLRTRAFVLRRSDYGESHSVILLATETTGTLSAVARHARKSTRRFRGGLEPFTMLDADLERRKQDGPWSLASTRILRYHEGYTTDLDRYAAGSWTLEIYRNLVRQEAPDADAFHWLAGTVAAFEHEMPDPVTMACHELALLSIVGHAPRFDRCVTCGREAPERSWAHFDPSAGGIVCLSCGGTGPRLSSRLRGFLRAAQEGEPDAVAASGDLHASALDESPTLRRALDDYIRTLTDREARSMRALRRAWGMETP